MKQFQSTLPARGATHHLEQPPGDSLHFNPRSPHGERLHRLRLVILSIYFNPRSPHGERLDGFDEYE